MPMKIEVTIRPSWATLVDALEHMGLRDILARMSGITPPEEAEIRFNVDSDERSGGAYVRARWDVDEIDPVRADLRDRSTT